MFGFRLVRDRHEQVKFNKEPESEREWRGRVVQCPRCNQEGPFHEGKIAVDVECGMGEIRTSPSARVFGCLACQIQFFIHPEDGVPRIVGYRIKDMIEREQAEVEQNGDRIRGLGKHDHDIPFGIKMP